MKSLKPVGNHKLLKLLGFFGSGLTLVLSAAGCTGVKGIGLGPGSVNEAPPTGTIIAQGSFNTQLVPNKTVTGSAFIYNTAPGQYAVYLQQLSTPNDVGLQVMVVGGGVNQTYALPNPAIGNLSFASFTVTGTPTFSYVSIHNPAYTYNGITGVDYAQAQLTATP